MATYLKINNEIKDIVRAYLKKGETAKISTGVIEYNNNLYREIVIIKNTIKSIATEGYIYIDNKNEIVKNRQVQTQLAKYFYYYNIFFNDEKGTSILNAIQSDGALQREKNDFQSVEMALDFLNKEGVDNAEGVKNIALKVPALREKNNEKLKLIRDIVEEIRKNNKPINAHKCDEIYEIYEDAMILNFEKVSTIALMRNYYDDIKAAADKKRKQFSIRFNKNLSSPLMKLSYEVSYFIKVINAYEPVLDMNTQQYMRFLSSSDKKNIQQRISLIRQ